MKNNNIDVYMTPLLEELHELWKGLLAWDVRKQEGHHMFTIWPILMWSIHALLAYGLFSGQVNKGYKGCPTCGPNTCVVVIPKSFGKLFMDVTTSGCNLLIHGYQMHVTSMGNLKER